MGEPRPVACSKKGTRETKHLLDERLGKWGKEGPKNQNNNNNSNTNQSKNKNKGGGFAYTL